MEAIYFGDIPLFFEELENHCGKTQADRLRRGLSHNIRMDCTYYPEINVWKGQKTIQIVIKNYRFNII